MAHAIHGYTGACKNIHGHSYELHVTVASKNDNNAQIAAPGFIIDFKEIKKIVGTAIIDILDHKLILSHNFLSEYPSFATLENLVIWEAEPTAENLLIFMSKILINKLPHDIKTVRMKLFETKDSYAEWINDNISDQY